MPTLPGDVSQFTQTPEFTEDSIPAGLRHAHRTPAGVWARIVVREGRLVYRILEPVVQEMELSSTVSGVIAPTISHEVEPRGAVRFHVEFYR